MTARSCFRSKRLPRAAAAAWLLACSSCLTLRHEVKMGPGASQAARGFSPQAERRMIYTYIGRIYASVEDYPHAIEFFEKKLREYPRDMSSDQRKIVDPEKAVIYNQMGAYAFRLGRYRQAWKYFREALRLAREQKVLHGEVVNAANLGQVALRLLEGAGPAEAESLGARKLLTEAARAQRAALARMDASPEYSYPEYRVYLLANLAALAELAAPLRIVLPIKPTPSG